MKPIRHGSVSGGGPKTMGGTDLGGEMATFQFIKHHKHVFKTTCVIACSHVKISCVFLFAFSLYILIIW